MKIACVSTMVLSLSFVGDAQKAQSLSESTGKIIDQTGGIIPSARIALINSNETKFESITNGEGIYRIRMPAGTYSIEAEHPQHQGWDTFKVEKDEIALVNKMSFDICLRVSQKFTDIHGTPVTANPTTVKKNRRSP